MPVDGALAEEQLGGYVSIRPAGHDEAEHLELPRAEPAPSRQVPRAVPTRARSGRAPRRAKVS